MNRLSLLISFLVLFAILSGCKKNDSGTPFKRIHTITNNGNVIYTYEYNSDGKVSGETMVLGAPFGYITTYTYSGNTITVNTIFDQSGSKIDTFNLNPQGYISDNGAFISTVHHSTFVHEYDNSGQLTKSTINNNIAQVEHYTYTNGNLTLYTTTPMGGSSYENHYEYYLDKENTLSNEHMGMNYWGKSNKNLVKTETYTTSSYSHKYNYTYEYDQDNYVTKRTKTGDDGTTTWETYKYE